MFNIILTVAKKEFKQIYRDKRTLFILVFFPMFMLMMFGYALNFDIKHIQLAVFDEDKTQTSREFVDSFIRNEYFDLNQYLDSIIQIDQLMAKEQFKAALVIPSGFSDNILNGNSPQIQIIIDGTNSNTAATIVGYVNAIIQDYSTKIILKSIMKIGKTRLTLPIDFKPRVWYNPELKSSKFLIPGLIGFILMIITVLTTSLSIVKEKERNTIEQIAVAPIKPVELILGKTLPHVLISLVASVLILTASYYLFGLTIKGSIPLLFLVTLIFLTGTLGMGLMISTIAETQQVAFMISVVTTLLPAFLLSGFVFPIRNMPVVIQAITYIIPVKYYLVVLRNILLKGTGLYAFWDQVLFLIAFAVVMITASSIRMSKK
jgi:ABC-2 type transport system permease protein